MSVYEKIYNAAIALDREALERIRAETRTLDECNGRGSVIEQLASESNQAAVTLLLSLDGSELFAARGYARAGLEALAWELCGYATVMGHIVQVLEFTSRLTAIHYAVEGAAECGHHALEAHLQAFIPIFFAEIASFFRLPRSLAPKVQAVPGVQTRRCMGAKPKLKLKLKLKQD